jgi:hypothetical protein
VAQGTDGLPCGAHSGVMNLSPHIISAAAARRSAALTQEESRQQARLQLWAEDALVMKARQDAFAHWNEKPAMTDPDLADDDSAFDR